MDVAAAAVAVAVGASDESGSCKSQYPKSNAIISEPRAGGKGEGLFFSFCCSLCLSSLEMEKLLCVYAKWVRIIILDECA